MADLESSTWSETDANNNTATPDGWPENMSYGATNNCGRAMMGALKRWHRRTSFEYTSGGSANAQTLTTTVAPSAYTDTMIFGFIAGATNTGACTFKVDSLAAVAIKRADGSTDLSAGDITSGKPHAVWYDGTVFRLIMPWLPMVLDASQVATAKIADSAATLAKLSADAKRQSIIIACSDETTALTTGAGKVTFRMPYAFTVTAVRASLTTAQASGNIFTVDINEGASSILSTKLTIDNNEKTSTTAATAAVISDSSIADDAEITIDIDQIGNGTAKGLKVALIGYNAT